MDSNQNSMMQMNMMTGGMRDGMGVMVGGLGLMGSPTHFMFIGNTVLFQGRLQNTTDEQYQNIKEATITVNGALLKPFNILAFIMTIMCGVCLIFPFFFFCMDWWKRYTYPAFSIPNTVYHNLQKFFLAPNISTITLTVVDNTFDQDRAKILYEFLRSSRVKSFTFINEAQPFDFSGNGYTNFKDNMKSIKQLPHLTSYIRWGDQSVQN